MQRPQYTNLANESQPGIVTGGEAGDATRRRTMNNIEASDYFAIIPEWVLYAPISPTAVRVFAILNRYANSNTGKCHPSRKSIAQKAHCGLSTVDRAIDDLTRIGAVTVRKRVSDNGDPTSNEYTLNMIGGLSKMNRPYLNLNRPLFTGEQRGLFKSDNQTIASMNESQEPSSSSADDGFDAWWKIYPRKVGKGAARKAWKTALKKTDVDTLTNATHLYVLTCPKDVTFIAHPASWLNAERWLDETMTTPAEPDPTPIPTWEPCDKCAGGWIIETDQDGVEYARPCECRP